LTTVEEVAKSMSERRDPVDGVRKDFNPGQPRDWHGRWRKYKVVIGGVTTQGEEKTLDEAADALARHYRSGRDEKFEVLAHETRGGLQRVRQLDAREQAHLIERARRKLTKSMGARALTNSGSPAAGVEKARLWDEKKHPRGWGGRWVRVFSYGSNLDQSLMESRAPGARVLTTGRLPDHSVHFPGGLPNARPTQGHTLHGVVHEVPEGSMRSLDAVESGYDKDLLTVKTPLGPMKNVVVYRMADRGGGWRSQYGGLHGATLRGRRDHRLPTLDVEVQTPDHERLLLEALDRPPLNSAMRESWKRRVRGLGVTAMLSLSPAHRRAVASAVRGLMRSREPRGAGGLEPDYQRLAELAAWLEE
jgi:gamma-glutamylcyclotransferase (GGCT)/AIG2-like uncharacterized protein YtfP